MAKISFFAPYLIGIRWRYHSKSQDNTAYCTRLHSLTLEKTDFDVSGKIESSLSYSTDLVALVARTFSHSLTGWVMVDNPTNNTAFESVTAWWLPDEYLTSACQLPGH